MRWLPSYCSENQRNSIYKLCTSAMQSASNEIASKGEKNQRKENALDNSDDNATDDGFLIFNTDTIANKNYNVQELELITYFNDNGTLLETLHKFPTIKKLFLRYNTSLCSSAAVERLFSFAGYITSPTRGSLSDNTFMQLVFMKGNQEYTE
uniref:HAT C-terminal dimerisation domain-containing protein n=1 Tax=Photinus pyralis TaxID=7054 RepID=A0A1Y1N9M8_PHOPY